MTIKEMAMNQPVVKIALFILGLQAMVLLGHWIIYYTLVFAFMPGPQTAFWLRVLFIVLAFSFMVSQVLVNLWNHKVLNFFYAAVSVWLGTAHFLVLASIIFWVAMEVVVPFGFLPPFTILGFILFISAVLVSAYGVVKSFRPQYVRYYVNIPNLPPEWKGHKAVVVSDVHLGPIRGRASNEKMVKMINAEKPDIVFIPGDLFDGPPVNFDWMAEPLKDLRAPLGVYFTEGNHEEFGDPAPFVNAVLNTGVKVLNREMAVIDGVQILGVPYENSNTPTEIRESLADISFDPQKPSILLKHAPSVPQAVAEAGVSLMLCGHTHNAQIWPYNFFSRQLFGKANHGHSRSGDMQVITTSGYGTWGPPQRVGTRAEVVVIKFY